MKPPLSPTRFRRAVATAARVFDVSEQDVLGPARHRPIARARLAVYAALYTACATSYPELAAYVRRDHTTVMHGVETAHRLARGALTHAEINKLTRGQAAGLITHYQAHQAIGRFEAAYASQAIEVSA